MLSSHLETMLVPGGLATAFAPNAIVTSWLSVYRAVEFPGCRPLLHVPLLDRVSVGFDNAAFIFPANDLEVGILLALESEALYANVDVVQCNATQADVQTVCYARRRACQRLGLGLVCAGAMLLPLLLVACRWAAGLLGPSSQS